MEIIKEKPIINQSNLNSKEKQVNKNIYIGVWDMVNLDDISLNLLKSLNASSNKILKYLSGSELRLTKSDSNSQISLTLFANNKSEGSVFINIYEIGYETLKSAFEIPIEYQEFEEKLVNQQNINLKQNVNENKLVLIKIGEHHNIPILNVRPSNFLENQKNEILKNHLTNEDIQNFQNELTKIYEYFVKEYSPELGQSYICDLLDNLKIHHDFSIDEIFKNIINKNNEEKENEDLEFGLQDHTLDKLELEYDFGFHSGNNVLKVPTLLIETGNFNWEAMKNI